MNLENGQDFGLTRKEGAEMYGDWDDEESEDEED